MFSWVFPFFRYSNGVFHRPGLFAFAGLVQTILCNERDIFSEAVFFCFADFVLDLKIAGIFFRFSFDTLANRRVFIPWNITHIPVVGRLSPAFLSRPLGRETLNSIEGFETTSTQD